MKKLSLLLVFLSIVFVSFAADRTRPGKTVKKNRAKVLVYPVTGQYSKVRDRWGVSRDGGRRSHKGMDIDARRGTPVVAVCNGIIVKKAITPIGGKTLWLKSTDHPWTAYYAHLDKQLVKKGQTVRKGQVIGTVGNTGNASTTPSHLHFGISKKAKWVDPSPIIKYSRKVATPKLVTKKKATATKKMKHKTKRARK